MTSQPLSAAVQTPAGIIESLAGLQDLDDLPTVEHVARFTAMHNSLTAALSSIDDV
ncbi:MAG: hypothetical protein WAN20_05435 [Pseudonocardiaceae bacterium]|jgi:hypothetical protein|nr:hypothetical protein [Pseudonocardiaceae bacterium]